MYLPVQQVEFRAEPLDLEAPPLFELPVLCLEALRTLLQLPHAHGERLLQTRVPVLEQTHRALRVRHLRSGRRGAWQGHDTVHGTHGAWHSAWHGAWHGARVACWRKSATYCSEDALAPLLAECSSSSAAWRPFSMACRAWRLSMRSASMVSFSSRCA